MKCTSIVFHTGIIIVMLAIAAFGCSQEKPLPKHGDHVRLEAALANTVESHGLIPANTKGDGKTEPLNIGGKDCQQLFPKKDREGYAYFRIDPAVKNNSYFPRQVTVEVEYFDGEPGAFFIEYDRGVDEHGKMGSPYARSDEKVKVENSNQWKKTRFVLQRPRFEGRQNDHADFRIRAGHSKLCVCSVALLLDY